MPKAASAQIAQSGQILAASTPSSALRPPVLSSGNCPKISAIIRPQHATSQLCTRSRHVSAVISTRISGRPVLEKRELFDVLARRLPAGFSNHITPKVSDFTRKKKCLLGMRPDPPSQRSKLGKSSGGEWTFKGPIFFYLIFCWSSGASDKGSHSSHTQPTRARDTLIAFSFFYLAALVVQRWNSDRDIPDCSTWENGVRRPPEETPRFFNR